MLGDEGHFGPREMSYSVPRSVLDARNTLHDLREQVRQELDGVVVGYDDQIDLMVVAAVAGGHVLVEGPPGIAKTLMAGSIARVLGVAFKRVQFTPDTSPDEITGFNVTRAGETKFQQGAAFTNVLLADEINRTPPRTQAALLEAMQERHVTVEGRTHWLAEPVHGDRDPEPLRAARASTRCRSRSSTASCSRSTSSTDRPRSNGRFSASRIAASRRTSSATSRRCSTLRACSRRRRTSTRRPPPTTWSRSSSTSSAARATANGVDSRRQPTCRRSPARRGEGPRATRGAAYGDEAGRDRHGAVRARAPVDREGRRHGGRGGRSRPRRVGAQTGRVTLVSPAGAGRAAKRGTT